MRGRPSRATVYARLDSQLTELRNRFGGLPSPEESAYVWADIWHLEAHHSTALEGNTLVLREVETLLDQGKAVGAKPLREYMEVKGYGDAASWVYREALGAGDRTANALITLQEVRHIHYLAMTLVWQVSPHPDATDAESPGNFRRHDIHPFEEGMTPPSWPLVPSLLDEWVTTINEIPTRLSGGANLPELLAEAHNHFERIHPFIDGNGRAGRLALNLVLVRLGYPPVVVLKEQRAAYLRAMQRADGGDFGPLGEILARGMIDNLNRFILPNVAGPAKLVPLASLVEHDLSLVALRAAAKRGRLDAHQRSDGQWLSTRKAVEAYKKSRHPGARRTTE
ncbi:MAG: Fic family protein [Propionicimonas sp.]|uniref:Fic family protein n=1 Tax=Brooklawnia propionicigenes TaxID=3041175 RepID=A0AAN0KEE1_9ACTN|nr:Fic family protein [Brooklawnia sp. SH051]MEA5117394.1 Fic family protein [Propionicimonas sp.]BEH01088.1 Fic family protein [Brooklawnia sp. SH051]